MATTPVSTSMPESQPEAKISPMGRLFGVLFAPKTTFADIVCKPGWLAPVIMLVLTGLLLNVSLALHANWNEVAREQIEKSRLASAQFEKMDSAQREQAYAKAAGQQKIVRYVRGVIGWPLLLLFVTAIYFLAYRVIAGARVTWGLAFTLVAFSHLPMGLREILGSLVTWLKDPSAIDPENYLASNAAAFLSPDAPTWQMIPLAFLDVFGIWALILMGIAFSVADPKKLPLGKSLGIAIGVNVALILFFTMIAWALS